jgi:hypothetical protein
MAQRQDRVLPNQIRAAQSNQKIELKRIMRILKPKLNRYRCYRQRTEIKHRQGTCQLQSAAQPKPSSLLKGKSKSLADQKLEVHHDSKADSLLPWLKNRNQSTHKPRSQRGTPNPTSRQCRRQNFQRGESRPGKFKKALNDLAARTKNQNQAAGIQAAKQNLVEETKSAVGIDT